MVDYGTFMTIAMTLANSLLAIESIKSTRHSCGHCCDRTKIWTTSMNHADRIAMSRNELH